MSEGVWQKTLLDILPVLYPQYIAVVREAVVPETISKGGKQTDRRIDHLLIDASGNVDVLEVKRAFPKKAILRGPYRDNYVPGYELAGGIEQVEKYLHYPLPEPSRLARRGRVHRALQGEAAQAGWSRAARWSHAEVCEPAWLLFIGHCEFDEGEQRDFDLIRRQYAHVVDVITYDDLLARLKRMAGALEG